MKQQTTMQQMLDELMAYEYTIPLDLIVKCKELINVETEQMKACYEYAMLALLETGHGESFEEYYNKTYNK